MNRFAHLLDRLTYEGGRLGKLAILRDYFSQTPDPDRGWALAAITGDLAFKHAKPSIIRDLAAARSDPVLFALSYDFVGDLAETVALMWEPSSDSLPNAELSLTEIVEGLEATPKAQLPAQLAAWLDRLDESGRWALLKLITGALRVGVSSRLLRRALAELGEPTIEEIEDAWHAASPPYGDLFAWIEGRGPRPESDEAIRFHPPMLSHAWQEKDTQNLTADDFVAEWKWDGIRVQVACGHDTHGQTICKLYSRTGEDISKSFPDLVGAMHFDAVLDGELLIRRGKAVQSFNTLQQRLNRKAVTAKTMADFPPFICVYDMLSLDGRDLRALTWRERRNFLERFISKHPMAPLELSPLVPFDTWEALGARRSATATAANNEAAVEGVMIKRADSPYLAGRPKGYWYKWKLDPHVVDAVLMYAQRGHGKRSSFYSDYTFGVWSDSALVPVGKAYFGFTDEELTRIDRFVRAHTKSRFGPVREVTHDPDEGLVFEIAFEGLQSSGRHKSGVAMRFPRISRIRWDKAPRDADQLATLKALLRETA